MDRYSSVKKAYGHIYSSFVFFLSWIATKRERAKMREK